MKNYVNIKRYQKLYSMWIDITKTKFLQILVYFIELNAIWSTIEVCDHEYFLVGRYLTVCQILYFNHGHAFMNATIFYILKPPNV